jgi:unsaturated chondroitin disaccharide hydrolase
MNTASQEKFKARAKTALEFAGKQLRNLITQYPDYFPLYTVGGKWKHGMEAWTNWCEGFLGGMLWIVYRYTKDQWWREQAEHYSLLIEHRKTDRDVHDLGFYSFRLGRPGFELTGMPPRIKSLLMQVKP